MKNSLFGVIIKVNNIDVCRNFYQKVLDLSDPVVDSSFCVEFQINDNFFLTLEKTDARFLEHQSSATSWSYKVNSIDDVLYRSRLHGYTLNVSKRTHEGEVLYRCEDPEKNIFYVFSDKEQSNDDKKTVKLENPSS